MKVTNLLNLCYIFFKIGLFSFGGGYAMISFIEREICEKKKWISPKEFLNIITIAEATPGVIAVNCASFVGYKVCGFFGGIFATLSVVLPSFIIIVTLSFLGETFFTNPIVLKIFKGLRAGVLILILNAILKLNNINFKKDFYKIFVYITTIITALFFKINSIYILIIMMILAIFYYLVKYKWLGEKE